MVQILGGLKRDEREGGGQKNVFVCKIGRALLEKGSMTPRRGCVIKKRMIVSVPKHRNKSGNEKTRDVSDRGPDRGRTVAGPGAAGLGMDRAPPDRGRTGRRRTIGRATGGPRGRFLKPLPLCEGVPGVSADKGGGLF